MSGEELLRLLVDTRALIEAYAASSAYVMRQAFESTKALRAFKGKTALAPALMARLRAMGKKPSDPVKLAAHLYALELTGSRRYLRKALKFLLQQPPSRADPMVGQLAGHIAAGVVKKRRRLDPAAYLDGKQLKDILKALG